MSNLEFNAYQLPPVVQWVDVQTYITAYRNILGMDLPAYRDELQRLYGKRTAYLLSDEELIDLFRIFQQRALEYELKACSNKAELSATKKRYGNNVVTYYWQNVFSDELKQHITQIAKT